MAGAISTLQTANSLTTTAGLGSATSASAAGAAVFDHWYNQKNRNSLIDLGVYASISAAVTTSASVISDVATAEAAEIDDLNITNEYIQSLSAEELEQLSAELRSLNLESQQAEKPRIK